MHDSTIHLPKVVSDDESIDDSLISFDNYDNGCLENHERRHLHTSMSSNMYIYNVQI